MACEAFPQSVAVVAAVGQEDLTFAEAAQHVGGASSVVSLAWRQLQKNGQAVGVDEGMDFRGQSASRAPHAAGYGTAGPEFVRRLINRDLDLAVTEARKMISTFVAKFVAVGVRANRAGSQKFALIGIADEFAARLSVTPWAKGEAQRAAVWAFKHWLDTRGGTGSHEENQAIEQVRLMMVQHGEARFECADGSLSPVRDRLGWYKGLGSQREWWVPPESWKAEFCAGLDPTMTARGSMREAYSGGRTRRT